MNFTITALCTTGGHITPEGAISVPQGGSQTFTFAVDQDHYFLQHITIDGVDVGSYMQEKTFNNVQADHTIRIVYHLLQFTFSIDWTLPIGSVSADPPAHQRGGPGTAGLEWVYDYGTVVTVTAIPTTGFTFVAWTHDVSGTDNPTILFMDGNKTVGFTYIVTPPTLYTLTPVASANGHISPSSAVQVAKGGSYSFVFIPDDGYEVADILVDGASVGAGSSYTFTNVQANHTISATFTAVVSPPGTYRITTVGWHVTIAPSNPDVAEHADQEFTFAAESSDYEVASIVIDGVSVGTVLTYTIENVCETHTVKAYGAYIGGGTPVPPTPPLGVGGGGGGRFRSVMITPYVSGADYADLDTDTNFEPNEQYVAWANPEEDTWPTEMFTHVRDLSGGEVLPVMTVRELPRTAIYLPKATAIGIPESKHIPFITERAEDDPDFLKAFNGQVLVRHATDASRATFNWETWKITEGIVTEPAPDSVVPYTAAYPDTWNEEALLSGFDVTHPGLFGSYWHADVHRSYLDVVKSNLGGEDWRWSLCRCLSFDAMPIPALATQFREVKDAYQLTCRSQHVLDEGQQAYLVVQVSEHSDFDSGEEPDERWCGTMTAVYVDYVYQYNESTGEVALDRAKTWYLRLKRVDIHFDEISQLWVVDTETGWTQTMIITSACRSGPATYNFSEPAYVPYYAYREYIEEDSKQDWNIDYKLIDEDTIRVHIQVATSESFETILVDQLIDRVWAGKWDKEIQDGWHVAQPLATCYARLRAENEDGSTVSPWSNIFELNSVDPINHYTDSAYVYPKTYLLDGKDWKGDDIYIDISAVAETHDNSVMTLSTELAFLGNDTLTYAILTTNGVASLYTLTSGGYTQILLENDYIYDVCLIAFGGKVYTGYQMYLSGIEDWVFVWRDVTDGVIGEAHVVPRPEGSDGFEWVTLGDIYGKLRVVASVVWYGGIT
jgi:hypothetical protein